MKTKIRYLLIFLGCLLIFPLNSKADCDYEKQAELSRIASNVGLNYSYETKNDNIYFYVDVTNVTNDIYLEDQYGNAIYNDGSYEYGYGNTISFRIYSKDTSCGAGEILTNYVTIPTYNSFNKTEECQKNPNFKYCKPWVDTSNVSTEKFYSELSEYLTTKRENVVIENTSDSFIEAFIEEIKNYKFAPLLLIAFMLLIIFMVVKKKVK